MENKEIVTEKLFDLASLCRKKIVMYNESGETLVKMEEM